MKYINIFKFLIVSLCLGYVINLYAMATNSPLGYWKTIDDVTGQPKSIIQLYENNNQTLSGKVVKIFPKPGEDQNKVCKACKGDKKNQKIVGMVILEGMKPSGDNKWDGGQILDPTNAKTYRCTFKLIRNGANLEVRGYIGISAFGRSQTWVREIGIIK